MNPDIQAPAANGEFLISRVFDFPRQLVFDAYTQEEHLVNWWGPKGFVMQVASMDLVPGGAFHYGMKSPEGYEMWGKLVFREIVAPEKLVFVVSFTDKDGTPIRHPMSATWPLEVLVTTTFSEHNGKTVVTGRSIAIHATDDERATFEAGMEGMKQGTNGSWDQLDAYLAAR